MCVIACGSGPVTQSCTVSAGETTEFCAGILNFIIVADAALNIFVETENIAVGLIYKQIVVKIEICAVFLYKNVDVFASSCSFQSVMGKINVIAVIVVDGKGITV